MSTTVAPQTPTHIPSDRISAATLEQLATRIRTAPERERMEIQQPFTGKLLGTVPKCSPEDVTAAIERARAAQKAWALTPFKERRRVLLRFHDLILARQEEILDLV